MQVHNSESLNLLLTICLIGCIFYHLYTNSKYSSSIQSPFLNRTNENSLISNVIYYCGYGVVFLLIFIIFGHLFKDLISEVIILLSSLGNRIYKPIFKSTTKAAVSTYTRHQNGMTGDITEEWTGYWLNNFYLVTCILEPICVLLLLGVFIKLSWNAGYRVLHISNISRKPFISNPEFSNYVHISYTEQIAEAIQNSRLMKENNRLNNNYNAYNRINQNESDIEDLSNNNNNNRNTNYNPLNDQLRNRVFTYTQSNPHNPNIQRIVNSTNNLSSSINQFTNQIDNTFNSAMNNLDSTLNDIFNTNQNTNQYTMC